MTSLESVLRLSGCTRLFIDGGSNLGDAAEAFFGKRSFYNCATHAPARLYGKPWQNATPHTRNEWMRPLAEPGSWCFRSFEANPKLHPLLRTKEEAHRKRGRNVKFIKGTLGTVTGPVLSTIYTYSKDAYGSGASRFLFEKVHSGKPPVLASEEVRIPGWDVRDVIGHALKLHPAALIALRLDVEGDEARGCRSNAGP